MRLIAAGQSVPAEVISPEVAALTEGVIQAMFVNKLRIAVAALLLLVAVLTGLSFSLHAQIPGNANAGQPAPFSGKAVFVEAGKNVMTVLEDVQVRTIGNRTFIVGRAVRENYITQEPFPGTTVWVPIETVERIVEFKDLADLKNRSGKK